MLSVADLKKGTKLIIDGDPYTVTHFDFVKPGKGQALYKCKMKNMANGSTLDRTYRSGESFEPAKLEEKDMEYLYKEGTHYTFMDQENYEQVVMEEDAIGDSKYFLLENTKVSVLLFGDKPIGVTLPNFMNLRVIQTDPWVKGDTSGSDSKPATIETGYILRVPPFIEEGELIVIDTRTGEYSTRVKG